MPELKNLSMTHVGPFEAKDRACELVEPVALGEERDKERDKKCDTTRDIARTCERPANLSPSRALAALDQVRGWAARVRDSRAGQPLGDGAPIRHMVEEGRR